MLERKNWVWNLFFMVITEGLYFLVLAHFMKLYRSESWYADYRYWFVAVLFLFFPVSILFVVFWIQMACTVANHLNVPGKEIYGLPYAWIVCLILPIVGWSLLIVMMLYIVVWSIVMLARGEGEKFIQ